MPELASAPALRLRGDMKKDLRVSKAELKKNLYRVHNFVVHKVVNFEKCTIFVKNYRNG